jgi:hypothetical protein
MHAPQQEGRRAAAVVMLSAAPAGAAQQTVLLLLLRGGPKLRQRREGRPGSAPRPIALAPLPCIICTPAPRQLLAPRLCPLRTLSRHHSRRWRGLRLPHPPRRRGSCSRSWMPSCSLPSSSSSAPRAPRACAARAARRARSSTAAWSASCWTWMTSAGPRSGWAADSRGCSAWSWTPTPMASSAPTPSPSLPWTSCSCCRR